MITLTALSAAVVVAIDLTMTSLYMRDVWRGVIKPHAFTWFIWFLLQLIVTAISLNEGALAGGLTFLVGALQCLGVCAFSWRRGDTQVTRGDWIAFAATLAAVPLWIVTKDPLQAAILVTLIDASGTSFTYRKAWKNPFEEHAAIFFIYMITGLLRMASLDPLNLTTGLYPAACILLDGVLTFLILVRRHAMKKASCEEALS